MANRRMFSLSVIDTDLFQDMPPSAQALYFHLGMHGDDDGFVSSPRKITRAAGCSTDDMEILCAKGFVIPFDSGVIVIRDWKLNNTIQNDRYKPTIYCSEIAQLITDEVGRYQLVSTLEPDAFQSGYRAEPQHKLEKINKEKHSEEREDKMRTRFTPPSVEDVKQYANEAGLMLDAGAFCDYYAARGWRAGNVPMLDWKAAVRTWVRRDEKQTKGAGESKPPRDDLALAERLFGSDAGE